ncbi:MAG: sigma-70 family RNA polymerase sigma factor [Proteobacteria bacterium]|nr:sigma-70 family RNA polymerase sigma factor [Pseudomonadota bacterium]
MGPSRPNPPTNDNTDIARSTDRDAALLEAWRGGDEDAGIALVRRYYPLVELFFMNKVTTEVVDLVQQTFEECLKSRDKIADPALFRPYLFSIAYNVLRMRFRRHSRAPTLVELDEITAYEQAPGPSSVVAAHQEQRLLLEALRRISLADQVLLELFYWEDMGIKEIGDILGCPKNTVKSRLRAARGRLEQTLRELEASPGVLKSTLTRLEDWASSIAKLRFQP